MYFHSAGSTFQQCPAHEAVTNNPTNTRETFFTTATKTWSIPFTYTKHTNIRNLNTLYSIT